MIALNTNVLVRFLVEDDKAQLAAPRWSPSIGHCLKKKALPYRHDVRARQQCPMGGVGSLPASEGALAWLARAPPTLEELETP